jgi:hypothetical protein
MTAMQELATGRGIHSRPNRGESVDWITPPSIIEALGKFDLDPCACPGQFYRTAKRMIVPPKDGLAARWSGRVWLNPPYGNGVIEKWMNRMVAHGNGIALVPSRTEVESWFWPYVWESASAVLFLRGRIWFRRPDGSRAGNAGHGSVLVGYGRENVDALWDAGIPGYFVEPDARAERAAIGSMPRGDE